MGHHQGNRRTQRHTGDDRLRCLPQNAQARHPRASGGDYCFARNPFGNNARDLEHFVKLFDYPPAEMQRAATKYGGELMGMGNELGLIKEGYLMLLVGGDVVADVTLLQGRNNC